MSLAGTLLLQKDINGIHVTLIDKQSADSGIELPLSE